MTVHTGGLSPDATPIPIQLNATVHTAHTVRPDTSTYWGDDYHILIVPRQSSPFNYEKKIFTNFKG